MWETGGGKLRGNLHRPEEAAAGWHFTIWVQLNTVWNNEASRWSDWFPVLPGGCGRAGGVSLVSVLLLPWPCGCRLGLTFLTQNQQLLLNMTSILALDLSVSVYCNEIHATTAARVVTIGKERNGNARSYNLNHITLWTWITKANRNFD